MAIVTICLIWDDSLVKTCGHLQAHHILPEEIWAKRKDFCRWDWYW